MKRTVNRLTLHPRGSALKEVPAERARVGQRIVWARAVCGMSQEALAMKLGVSARQINRWESGELSPPADKLTELAGCLGRTPDQLLLDVLPEKAPPDLYPLAVRLVENLRNLLRMLAAEPPAPGVGPPAIPRRKEAARE
jgi:transcriptional regulator with XRE-family HTH domain